MTIQTDVKTVKRDYKSRMFTMIFRDKKELLQLYNAVAKRNYEDPELLTITTLENAIYMSMQNDLSFIIDLRASLYEHQSTYNPNMPLRFLTYIAEMYEDMIRGKNIYGTKLVLIPAPRFIVFYNGKDVRPEREMLKLSDAYMTQDEEVSLELVVEVLNINIGYNVELLKACKTLGDYSEYVCRVRRYAEKLPIEEAVEKAITECICEGILKEFLEKNRAEAKAMSIYEYNQEEHMRMEREDACREHLLSLIKKKLKKGKSLEVIADEVEETVDTVKQLIKEIGANF